MSRWLLALIVVLIMGCDGGYKIEPKTDCNKFDEYELVTHKLTKDTVMITSKISHTSIRVRTKVLEDVVMKCKEINKLN